MQARETITAENGRLCATPFGVDVVGITEVVALTGALVGGAHVACRAPLPGVLLVICSRKREGR